MKVVLHLKVWVGGCVQSDGDRGGGPQVRVPQGTVQTLLHPVAAQTAAVVGDGELYMEVGKLQCLVCGGSWSF